MFRRLGLGFYKHLNSKFLKSISTTHHKQNCIPQKMSGEVDRSLYVLPLEQPFVNISAEPSFNRLSKKEKLYAYYLSEGAWIGGLITLLQTSIESGPIFVVLHKVLSALPPDKFRSTLYANGFSDGEITAFLVYAAGVFSNAGNYKGFGDTIFIPGLNPARFEHMLKVTPVWSDIQSIWFWFKLKERLFDLRPGRICLGFPPHGCTTYFSSNCGPADAENVQTWLKKHNLECYNTRCFKTENQGRIFYEIRLASVECDELQYDEDGRYVYRLIKGDYSPLLSGLIKSLQNAIPFTNQTENFMLQAYIRSFTTGSLNEHKQGSRLWVQNKGPAIETYIGFIETYRDPAGVRGEFEGFVAAVNRPMSEKFSALVQHAEYFISQLPWPRGFEKDKFLRPDFTSLDVLAFAGSGVPAGINIPNYDEIRQSEGFKNVSLGNVIPASYQYSHTPFLSPNDARLLKKWRVPAFELQVGLHELLGHGTGKLLQLNADGYINYSATLVNPLTGKPVTSCYQPGDTYDSKFGAFSSAYEECRAEAVGLYLSLEPKVLEIFGHTEQQADEVSYVNWLSLLWAGAGRSLEMWEPGRGWLQAHSQARFVLARILIQSGAAKVVQPKHGELLITLDKNAIRGPGRNAIAHFLLQLQVYKSTADVESAKKLFLELSDVVEPWLSWRAIVIANKQPRNILVQPNIIKINDDIVLQSYDSSVEGLLNSWLDRFDNPEPLYSAIIQLARGDMAHFM